ncbi:hypothetical protein AB4Y85_13395 [Microvirga sp. 2YAF29]|uniref:hypothetical protein n=1 Tax=Microvirga sp. 2YAF29 TaxID=3233031 RepID=UPI003F9D7807
MFDYLLVYYLLAATSAAPQPSNMQVNNPALVNRPGAVSAQERFTSLEQCQQRIEALRMQVAQVGAISERFELDCHPVQKSGASS